MPEVIEVDAGGPAEDEVGDELGGGRGELQAGALVAGGDDQVRDSPGRRRGRGVVSMLPGRRPAQVGSTSAPARIGQSRRASSSRSRTPRGGGPAVEAGVFLGRPDQDAAIVAGDEVVLAVLDDPAEQRPIAPEQDDLPLERRRRRLHPHPSQQAPPDQGPAATTTQPQGIAARRVRTPTMRPPSISKPTHRLPRAQAARRGVTAALDQRLEVPRVADLGAVGQEVRRPAGRG